jgi:protein-S-isoprenylcysteine O-methyltransferase Ste14
MGDETKFFAGLALVTLTVCGALWFFGRWLSRRVSRSKEARLASVSLTPAGYAWVAIQVILMVTAVALIELFPDNALGRWISASPGISFVLFVIICAAVGGILGRRGTRLLEVRRRDA